MLVSLDLLTKVILCYCTCSIIQHDSVARAGTASSMTLQRDEELYQDLHLNKTYISIAESIETCRQGYEVIALEKLLR